MKDCWKTTGLDFTAFCLKMLKLNLKNKVENVCTERQRANPPISPAHRAAQNHYFCAQLMILQRNSTGRVWPAHLGPFTNVLCCHRLNNTRLTFSNTQQSQELLGASFTCEIIQPRYQQSRTKQTLFPCSTCTGSSAPWCSHVPPFSCDSPWVLLFMGCHQAGHWEQAALCLGSPTQPCASGAAEPYCSVHKWKWKAREKEESKAQKAVLGAAPAIQAGSGALLG